MKQIYLVFLLALFILIGCKQRDYSNPGPSLIYVTFNGEVSNTGILPVEFRGQKYVSFSKGISDTCLNLSKNALFRKPVIIDKGSANRFNDYEGLTIIFWVKTDPNDPNEYVIIGQKSLAEDKNYSGWHISKTKTGSWRWVFRNGNDSLQYAPTHAHQPINDGGWHQIGFTMNKSQGEARFFYNGNLKAILSTENMDLSFPGTSLYAGADPLAQNMQTQTFNGMIDELGVWSRAFSNNQVAGLYNQTSGRKLKPLPAYKDSITMLTWNI
ncbi:MAG TPA: LamG domain-containing protein, partial [Bacteroidales bacterium]|nr:LamG domain-containing protein [Bacteroidales bacterium]